MRTSITKIYPDFPFAHRQPKHKGHCALIHGHNWTFEITMEATTKDECGFIYDFGKMKAVKAWLEDHFDHTLCLNADDPLLDYLDKVLAWQNPLAKIVKIPDCSCEGIAEFVLAQLNKEIEEPNGMFAYTANRNLRVTQVKVWEDTKNSATAFLT